MKLERSLLITCALCLLPEVNVCCGEEAPRWWLQPHRLLQTNLREIDATMDLDRYIREVKEFGADVVLFNVGGIVANYPTGLEFHWRNTFMKGDLVGTVLERLHAEGLRMIGRFDFSKINEKFAAEHPEWLYVSESGEHVNYNGQVHTCVSGGYQQEYMFKILGEAVDRYPLDGVFFNMIGYQRSDYSGNRHGICQCENCKRLFKEYSGMDLPPSQDSSPTYRKYVDFTNMMKDRQFNRVNTFLKKKRPDLAICTYTSAGVDVIRKESNRALGQGTYYDTDKAKWTLLTCGERQLANAAVHFIAIPYRHAAVSPHLSSRRVWQHMVNGAWLDFYCIGPLQRQEDRTGLDLVGEIYRFHAANESWLAPTEPAGQVGLVRRGGQEYEGILRILSESQIAYELTRIEPALLRRSSLVIVPDSGGLEEPEVAALDDFVKEGGKLLLTTELPGGLDCLGQIRHLETIPPSKGSYVRIRAEDKERLSTPFLTRLDLVFLRGDFRIYETGPEVEKFLRLIPGDMFGPPEKCYYRKVSPHPALLFRKHSKGAVAAFPFAIGKHYEEQAHQGHAALFVGTIDKLLALDRRLQVSTSPLVEVTHRTARDGSFEWVSLYNHSGQRGNALHEPLPVSDIQVTFLPAWPVKAVRLLQAGREIEFEKLDGGRVSVTVPTVKLFEVVVFDYD